MEAAAPPTPEGRSLPNDTQTKKTTQKPKSMSEAISLARGGDPGVDSAMEQQHTSHGAPGSWK